MRLFLAIELPSDTRQHLAEIIEEWKGRWDSAKPVSWVRPQNLHVTLKFFGEVEDKDIPSLCEALKLVESPGRTSLIPTRVECFPDREPVRVITLAIDGDEGRLVLVHRQIEERCHLLGYPREPRRYRPHITLARCRTPLASHMREKFREKWSSRLPGPPFEAREFVLMESRLGPEGAEYVPLARFPLERQGENRHD